MPVHELGMLSAEYVNLMAVEMVKEASMPYRIDERVGPVFVDRFESSRTLDVTDLSEKIHSAYSYGHEIGTVFFMLQSLVRIRHPEDVIASQNEEFTGIEILEGKRLITSDFYVPVARDGARVEFATLTELKTKSSLTEFTRSIVDRLSHGRRYGNAVTHALLEKSQK